MAYLLVLASCAPVLVQTVDYEREVWGTTLVAGPAAPDAVGPVTPVGKVVVDAGLSLGARDPVTTTREEGAPGMWVSRDAGTVHFAVGATPWLEFGTSFELHSAETAEPLALGMPALAIDPVVVTLGAQVRMAPEFLPKLRAGALVEFDLTSTGYERRVRLSTTTAVRESADDRWHESVDTQEAAETGTAMLPTGRLGALVLWTPDPLHVGLGTSVRSFQIFEGYSRQTWGCRTYVDGSSQCDEEPDLPEYLAERHAVDVWVETGVRLDRVWLLLTLWATVSGDDGGTPAGATVVLRYSPGSGE